VARPSLLTRARHERIVEMLSDEVPFATACRVVGVSRAPDTSGSAGAGAPIPFGRRHRSTWRSLERSTRSSRAASPRGTKTSLWRLRAATEQSAAVPVTTEGKRSSGRLRKGFPSFPSRLRARVRSHVRTGAKQVSAASVRQRIPAKCGVCGGHGADEIRHATRSRARVEGGDKEPRHAPMPWLSQRSRGELSILDIEF
jgi:hypothetical protein